jgi:hypothetical protein
MGGSLISVGVSMAIARPQHCKSMVTSAVISVTSTMPVRPNDASEQGDHPDHGESFRLNLQAGKSELAGLEEQSELRP